MTREDIVKQVNKVLAEEFETEESKMTPDANLKDALNLDSLSLVDLVAVSQYTYKLKVPVEDLRKINTFNDLYDYIYSHVAK